MTVKARINTRTVISALSHLEADRYPMRVSAEDISRYLEAPLNTVIELLRELEAVRLFRRKRGKDGTYIVPWEGQHG